ncbi:hypothetical protein [Treponema sp.]|uniref:hypothetical protein n=1 Tax=Treponema sp. TaxID=166 RepID=UPI00298EB93B|nr:hypothetical protein [Treponema sp.]MCR5612824.1 hypothetical protein [Treponema sp.]
MYEIELKAHVYDRQKTISLVNNFATFLGTTIKDDTYFHLERNPNLESGAAQDPTNGPADSLPRAPKHLTCRIRHEIHTNPDGTSDTRDLLTYKSKEVRSDSNGASYEVNEENETSLSEPEALKKLLLDSNWSIAYTKHKDVTEWTCATPYGDAHIELCNVPPLGDFLEIEIVKENCDNESSINEQLKQLILKAGLSLTDIEKKYYSELLKEASGGKNV